MTKAAVLGSPIAHSLSPVIHSCAYQVLGWDWSYEKHDVASGGLAAFLENRKDEFRGLSLTMPLKEEALGILDEVDDLAKQVNGVNTIVFDELGSTGYNTDVQGFRDSLAFHHFDIPARITIIGGGATARSAIAAVDGQGRIITVFSRSEYRAKSLVNSAPKAIVNVLPWDRLDEGLDAPLVISTTPKGATDGLGISRASGLLFESLYNPWPTLLLDRWRSLGGAVIDGLDLLVWQAIGQLEVMGFAGEEVIERRAELYVAMRAAALHTLQP